MVVPDRLRAQTTNSYLEELFLATLVIQISCLLEQGVPELRSYKILGKKKKKTKQNSI